MISKSNNNTILVVDDELETIRVLQLSLRGRGYLTKFAQNGREALTLCEKHDDIGLILTDYSMPGMNGMELLRAIRNNKKRLPVILMTAYGEKKVLVEALRNECDGFIEKPFAMEELLDEIERVQSNAVSEPSSVSSEMSELMPMLVHQINNPLTAIMGNVQLGMVQSEDSDPIKGKLTHILRATQRIQEINNEILKLGKSLSNNFEQIDTGNIVRDCLDSLSSLAKVYGVTINYHCDQRPMTITGNRFGLEQMFCNLIANGLEAMKDTSNATLNVQLMSDVVRNAVDIRISDNGNGMAPEVVDKIFSPYFTTKTSGTGLGLAVVKRVVGGHNGTIQVQSRVGKGTVFAISLPQHSNNRQSATCPHTA